MRLADPADLKTIYGLFSSHREIFPHVRQDYLRRRIEAKQCIFEDGVVVIFQRYRKRTRIGDLDIPAGAITLHQIVNGNQFNGSGGTVFDRFFNEVAVPSGGDLYLSVREANTVACQFYERHGMEIAGKVAWSGGTIPGFVYRKTLRHASAPRPNRGARPTLPPDLDKGKYFLEEYGRELL